MKIKLSNILPNPKRDLKRNPLNEKKLKELVSSIHETGFWQNVVVRKRSDGKYECAYGHHRIEAARRAGLTEADFVVCDLSNAQMHRIMARENNEVYGFSVASLFETVRGVVNGLADGSFTSNILLREDIEAGKGKKFDIILPADTKKNSIRYAPSFVPGPSPESGDRAPYTVNSIARFLGEGFYKKETGQASNAVNAVMNALHLIEIGQLKEEALLGLPLDSPINGLIQTVRATYARLTEQEERAKVMQEQMKREQKRKSEAQKAQIASTQKRMTKVRAEETKNVKKPTLADPGPSLDAKLATKKEQAKQNAANIATKGPELEAKLATKVTVDPKEVERNNAANILRQRIDAMVKARLDLLAITNKEVLSNELAYLWKNVQDTIQRKRIFDALNNVSTYFDEWARRFPGKPPRQSAKDMLSEEYKKEEAKRRKEENAE